MIAMRWAVASASTSNGLSRVAGEQSPHESRSKITCARMEERTCSATLRPCDPARLGERKRTNHGCSAVVLRCKNYTDGCVSDPVLNGGA